MTALRDPGTPGAAAIGQRRPGAALTPPYGLEPDPEPVRYGGAAPTYASASISTS